MIRALTVTEVRALVRWMRAVCTLLGCCEAVARRRARYVHGGRWVGLVGWSAPAPEGMALVAWSSGGGGAVPRFLS